MALNHDFYEVDYLPENDRIRYTISPEARKEILKRLLELNHKIHEQEEKDGLLEKTTSLSRIYFSLIQLINKAIKVESSKIT